MEYLNKDVIACFFQTNEITNTCINLTFFDIQNSFEIIKNLSIYIDTNCPLEFSKSTIDKEKQKIFGFFIQNQSYYFYIGYDYDKDELKYDRIYINININRKFYFYFNFIIRPTTIRTCRCHFRKFFFTIRTFN